MTNILSKNLRLPILLLGISFVLTLLFVLSPKTSALSESDFSAGYIISDSIFTNDDSMSVSQIQSFLSSKVPSCDTNGSQLSEMNNSGVPDYNGNGSIQRWEWGKKKYNQTTFPCLKDYQQGGKSAAQIIYDASNEYSINPQVLIVLLQKEQGLVTDTWPLTIQYRSATGYGCPDDAPCDSEYYGLTNQLDWAAKMFRAIMNDSPSWYTPYEVGDNYIQYNPNSSCGGSTVNIKNRATQALYNYTPYQPNAATLQWKLGDGPSVSSAYPGCGAFGNINFFTYFTSWFGTTYDTPFFKINGEPEVYMNGADGKYYYVSSNSMLRAYGYRSEFSYIRSVSSSYLSGKTLDGQLSRLARFEGAQIYAITSGDLHLFSSRELLESYGFEIGEEAELQEWVGTILTTGASMGSVLRVSDNSPVYYVENGRKRHITTSEAYTTLGSPTYSSQPSAELDSFFAGLILDGSPILLPGTVVYNSDTQAYGVWSGSALMMFATQVGSQLTPPVHYVNTSAIVSQLPTVTTVNSLVKNSSNIYYFLNIKGSKISVSTAQISALELETEDFIQVNDSFLSSLTTKPYPTLLRSFNTDPVYLLLGGTELLRFNSRNDVEGLGYSLANVTEVATPVTALFTNNGKLLFKPGQLVRIDQQSAIYVIDTTSRLYIPSKELLESYGYKSSNVLSIASTGLAHYPVSSTMLHWYVQDSSGTFWLIVNGQRLKIKPPLSTANYDVRSAVSLSTPIVLTIPEGAPATKFIRANSTDKIYLIDNGQKRWVSSESRLKSLGGSSTTITNVPSGYLNSLPTGPNA